MHRFAHILLAGCLAIGAGVGCAYIAGIGESGFNGDALPPSSTALSFPSAVVLDPISGDVYIADTGNRRIRRFAR